MTYGASTCDIYHLTHALMCGIVQGAASEAKKSISHVETLQVSLNQCAKEKQAWLQASFPVFYVFGRFQGIASNLNTSRMHAKVNTLVQIKSQLVTVVGRY